MEMINLSLPGTSRFATDYAGWVPGMERFFHYKYHEPAEYRSRIEELNNRKFHRNELADHISAFMAAFPGSTAINKSIEKLRQENSVVIMGGQQAGILTGPLYTIHKIISIISFAKQKERELNIPVVPVFWIAGEDHDFQEVNHVYVCEKKRIEKWNYPERILEKKMVSDIQIDEEICKRWIEEVIESYGETEHTSKLLQFTGQLLKKNLNFVDFFSAIILELFKEYGLLIVDSGNRDLRMLEKEILIRQIKDHQQITNAVHFQQQQLVAAGYNKTIEIAEHAANLFYYDSTVNERILLEFRPEAQLFIGKNGRVSFTEAELIELANEFPEKLSNNVVTRPLTQEWLFPTLSFIGGPGEIAYWAELTKVFEHFQMKVPPIVPRLNMTILDRSLETDLTDLEISVAEALTKGVEAAKYHFLNSIKDDELERLFSETRQQLNDKYQLIQNVVKQKYAGLLPLLEKNEKVVQSQIDFMADKLDLEIRLRHANTLNKLARIETALKPLGLPQERVWNIFYYLNKYGLDFVNELLMLPYEFDGTHKIIKV
ncbi:bacillithiol biosynthesis cysteine-adding enzyme BshC [Bacillus canaveralius]|uniref:Putative cysteine ligase BshC n=1 Tax=Bacillus canaveralius TaxID=1403243 RepID=A0A2N5GNR6_9BACI|nr:bacillithiol biosynthesis cysteine-adding enzyme BshC [Bacillus canaveralius]PLR84110.1 bacillithiol biosynthesis cysteine-adding enzyme BshC [Bacillus canaveralius]PLR96244.1 bacillithiol biosynthesis cysteine-adding enzyme BshC [Bacillus canaveralius]